MGFSFEQFFYEKNWWQKIENKAIMKIVAANILMQTVYIFSNLTTPLSPTE